MDVAFVIDTSGSVTQANFNRIIQFLKLFVDRFDFPDSGTRSVSARKLYVNELEWGGICSKISSALKICLKEPHIFRKLH